MESIIYRSFTIQEDWPNPYESKPQLMFYRTDEGVSHDADCTDGETFSYCGNCTWTDCIDDAKAQIDEWEDQNEEDLKLYNLERKG